MKLMPPKATEEMIDAWLRRNPLNGETFYSVMYAVAPEIKRLSEEEIVLVATDFLVSQGSGTTAVCIPDYLLHDFANALQDKLLGGGGE